MHLAMFLVGLLVLQGGVGPQTTPPQRKRPVPRTAALAILVTDAAGAQVPNVSVTLEGPMPRSARTEGGRIAFENLAPGDYLLRFEKDGFLTLERQLILKAGAPADVKVTLKPAPQPPAPPPPVAPVKPEKPASDAKPAVYDVPSVIEKQYIGRAPEKRTTLACGSDGSSTLIQLNDPITDHQHAEADEFLYVVAGEGAANVGGSPYRLQAGVLVFVPRGVTHRFSKSGRNPLIVLSMLAGGGCEGGQTP
jgi:mannose-6-phosphate isomerase-like protein (cupin superfamily)